MKKLILIILLTSCTKIFKPFNFKIKGLDEDLELAIEDNDTKKIIKLIEEGANVNYVYKGKSIIDLAIIKGNLEIIKALMEKKVEIKEDNLVKIFYLALDHFNCNIIELIKDKYDLNESLIDADKYLLFLCYASNSEEVKKFIEKNKINPLKIKDKMNRNCLILSASNKRADTSKMLIEQFDFNINDKDNDGCTALMVASEKGNIETVELLLEKGASVNDKDEDGVTPLMFAAKNDHLEIAKLILARGANINDRGNYGWTTLMLASKYDHIGIAELLTKNGANINDKEIDGLTSLMIASQNGNTNIVKYLLEKGADIDDKDNKGWTAMMLALKEGHINTVKLLLEKSNDINNK